jgi:rhamnogalacturonyl hydrolase YesR
MFKQMLELELSEEALETAASTFAVLVSRIDDAMNAGLLERRDEVEVAQQFWNGMHGGVLLELAGIAFTADPEQTFADMLDALLRGSAAK